MKIKIDCPYCNGSAFLKGENREITYKEETLTVKAYFYQCESCLEEFTTTETDNQTKIQVMVHKVKSKWIP
jgi:YgiT-type zinc finger domain-containing protein